MSRKLTGRTSISSGVMSAAFLQSTPTRIIAWPAKACLTTSHLIRTPRIYRLMGELEPNAASDSYEALLHGYFGKNANVGFDFLLLGMGEDGHTASIFPGTAPIFEQKRWTAAHYVDKLAAWRLTLTPAFLNLSSMIMFLVSGAAKQSVLHEVLHGANQPERLPAQVIRPSNGKLTWLVDQAAAGG